MASKLLLQVVDSPALPALVLQLVHRAGPEVTFVGESLQQLPVASLQDVSESLGCSSCCV